MKNIYLIIIINLIIISGIFAQKIGEPAPDFSFKDYNGNEFTLSDHKGKVVFIFTFGNGCPNCLAIGNETQTKVQDVYGSRSDFVAVGVDFWDNTSSNTSVKAFAERTGILYPLLVKAGAMETAYETSYDRILIVDKEGNLIHKNDNNVASDLDNAINVIEENLMTLSDEEMPVNILKVNSFPVPASDQLNLSFSIAESSDVSVRIYNTLGQLEPLKYESFLPAGNNRIEINTRELDNGIYLYNLRLRNGENFTGRFVVRK